MPKYIYCSAKNGNNYLIMDDADSVHGSLIALPPATDKNGRKSQDDSFNLPLKEDSTSKDSTPKESWWLLLAIFPTYALCLLGVNIFPVMYVDLATTFHVSMATAGLVASTRQAVVFISSKYFSKISYIAMPKLNDYILEYH